MTTTIPLSKAARARWLAKAMQEGWTGNEFYDDVRLDLPKSDRPRGRKPKLPTTTTGFVVHLLKATTTWRRWTVGLEDPANAKAKSEFAKLPAEVKRLAQQVTVLLLELDEAIERQRS